MEDINIFTKDESLNDKILIKELSVYLKNHRDKNKPINKSMVLDIIKIIQSNYGDIGLSKIIFHDTKEYENDLTDDLLVCGSVVEDDFNSLTILNLCMLNIFNTVKFFKKSYNGLISDDKLLKYFVIVETLVHELTHVKQSSEIKASNYYYYKVNDFLVKNYSIEYIENYDIIPMERFAELRAISITYEVLSYIYSESQIYGFKLLHIEALLNGYIGSGEVVKCPVEQFDEVLKQCDLNLPNIDYSECKSLYSRLYLGLPITSDEYYAVCDIIENFKKDTLSVKEMIQNIELKQKVKSKKLTSLN